MSADRHEKWVRVEPGHVIPAGQPYGIEYPDTPDVGLEWAQFKGLSEDRFVGNGPNHFFVDSSWRPPLNLPTEPTWGIAVRESGFPRLGQWRTSLADQRLWNGAEYIPTIGVIDFIPLTDEQVARIEQAQ